VGYKNEVTKFFADYTGKKNSRILYENA